MVMCFMAAVSATAILLFH